MIDYECTQCKKRMRSRPDQAGKRARCPYCQAAVNVPMSTTGAAPAAAAAAPPPPVTPAPPAYEPPAAYQPVADSAGFDFANEQLPPDARVPCPNCRELIVHTAAKCHFCGEIFDFTRAPREESGRWYMISVGIIWLLFSSCIFTLYQGGPDDGRSVPFERKVFAFLLAAGLIGGWGTAGVLAILKKAKGIYLGLALSYAVVLFSVFRKAPRGASGAYLDARVFTIIFVVVGIILGHIALVAYTPARKQ